MPHAIRLLLSGFDPHTWRPAIRNLRAAEGWRPPMFLIAVVACVAFVHGFIRPFLVAKVLAYLWATPWVLVSSVACGLALVDSCRNLLRYRIVGYRRPRFWFEAARTSCIVGTLMAVATLIVAATELPTPGITGSASIMVIAFCWTLFTLACTTGYLIGVFTRRKRMGRAKECASFFYPLVLGGLIVTCFVLAFPGDANDPRSYIHALATLVVACLAGATLLTLASRRRRRRVSRDRP